MNVPSLSFSYQLQSNTIEDQVTFRDVGSGGTFAFEAIFTVEPPKDATIELVLEGDIKSLGETNISYVETGTMGIEDLVSTAPSKQTESVAWSERIAFHVRLADPEQRTRMWLKPVFMMFTAHLNDPQQLNTGDFSYDHVTSSTLRDTTFCDLDTANAAAILQVDDGHQDWANNDLKTELSGIDLLIKDEIDMFTGITNQLNFHVNDTSGGFAVPLRNTLRLPSGEAGGFSLRMCAVTELVPRPLAESARRHLLVVQSSPFPYANEETPPPHAQQLMAFFEPPSLMNLVNGDDTGDEQNVGTVLPHTPSSASNESEAISERSFAVIVGTTLGVVIVGCTSLFAMYLCKPKTRKIKYHFLNQERV